MLTFKSYIRLIEEGGAAGHMAHPFDLPFVRSGKDLINLFEKVRMNLKTTPAVVKIDGVNCSIKLVTNDDGSMEFGLDRGSKNPLDVKGITIKDLTSRFPEGHGFIEVGKTVLEIFNKSLPTISGDLKKLGFLKNKNLILNTEYVAGSTNVIGYAENFLAIHGINESYEFKSPVRGSISRKTREVAYNAEALEDLISKVNPIAEQYGFKIYSSVAATIKTDIDYTPSLNTKLSIHYTPEHVVTKTLRAWLERCGNPIGTPIKLVSGKTVDAVSKNLYLSILNGTPLTDIVEDGNKKQDDAAVCGAVIYHATRLLGNAVLTSMTSSIGDLENQEGIVIRDPKISPTPFKITGEFIVRGMASVFKKEDDEELEGSPIQDVTHGIGDSNYLDYDNENSQNNGRSYINTVMGDQGGRHLDFQGM